MDINMHFLPCRRIMLNNEFTETTEPLEAVLIAQGTVSTVISTSRCVNSPWNIQSIPAKNCLARL